MRRNVGYTLMLIFSVLSLFSCAGTQPRLGITDNKLSPCPPSPNCVSSDATDKAHSIPPFTLIDGASDPWKAVREAVMALPRTTIVREENDYLHAECQSQWLGFVDDMELHWRVSEGIIAVRSSSRLGHGDFGVNRHRVERLRSALIKQGLLPRYIATHN